MQTQRAAVWNDVVSVGCHNEIDGSIAVPEPRCFMNRPICQMNLLNKVMQQKATRGLHVESSGLNRTAAHMLFHRNSNEKLRDFTLSICHGYHNTYLIQMNKKIWKLPWNMNTCERKCTCFAVPNKHRHAHTHTHTHAQTHTHTAHIHTALYYKYQLAVCL